MHYSPRIRRLAATISYLKWLLILGVLSGCTTPGPIGTPRFDPHYRQTLEQGEVMLFSAQSELIAGTYMEGEMETYPSYNGVLLLTDQRLLFGIWNETQKRYEPLIWTTYSHIAQVKKQNNTLLQYIAMIATDDSKFTYMLSRKNVDQAHRVLLDQIRISHPTQQNR